MSGSAGRLTLTSPGRCAVLAVVLALTGCSGNSGSRELAEGPLGEQPPESSLCTISGPGRTSSVGIDVVRNSGSEPVTLESVTLVNPSGLGLGEAFLVPITNRTLLGTSPTFPPAGASQNPAWPERQEARGAVVRPGEELNLLLEVHVTDGPRGTADLVEVVYRGDDTYVYRTNTELTVQAPGTTCG